MNKSRPLIGLPEGTAQIRFTNMGELEHQIVHQAGGCLRNNNGSSPFLVVVNAPATIVKQLSESLELPKIHISFDQPTRVLVIEWMVSKSHEQVERHFERIFEAKVERRGLRLSNTGSARVEQGIFAKDPDGSWEPDPRRAWPTVVLEIGWSESGEKLAIDAQGWLEAESSEVEIVVTLDIDRHIPKLTVQKWIRTAFPRRATRSSHAGVILAQEAVVSRSDDGTEFSGGLSLDFEKVFARSRDPNRPEECDIEFSQEDLVNIAEEAWTTQGFLG